MAKSTNTFHCFSPPIMLATFAIEISLAIYTVARYKMTPATRLVAAMLVCLAVFQLAEFNVCGRNSAVTAAWSRIGYVTITMLPPLSLHLVHVIANKQSRILVWLGYGTGMAFATIFGLGVSAFVGHICAGNYAIFQLTPRLGGMYFSYYYLLLSIGIGLSLFYSIRATQRIRQALILHASGYLSFLLPTAFVNAVNPQTITGIPSIMCGFAVIYALVLVFGILPIVGDHSFRILRFASRPS